MDQNLHYPWVEFPECMPKQEYIKLPEVQDKDLPDILSTDLLEQGTDKVKIKIIENNPSADQVTDIKIKDINTKILEQKYDNRKSEVIVELYNPIRYISSYSLQSITTKGAFNMPYTRSFKENERKIEVDLYREISLYKSTSIFLSFSLKLLVYGILNAPLVVIL